MLYFIHGWGLTGRSGGLVRNHFIAWQLGPVILSVFDEFRKYGDGPIENSAVYLDYITGIKKIVEYTDISEEDKNLIIRIFDTYDHHTTSQLVNMAHEPGGPWDVVLKEWQKERRLNPRIPNHLIRDHFLKMAGGRVRH